MLNIRCQCGKSLKVPESAIGSAGKCPFCHVSVRLVAPHYKPRTDDFAGRFVIAQGPHHEGEQLLLGGPGPIEIGKLPEKPIHLTGKKVSRSHCRLTRTDGGWRIDDQGSTNGISVNGQKTQSHDLADGDAVQIGEYLLQFTSDAASHGSSPGAAAHATGAHPRAAPPPSKKNKADEAAAAQSKAVLDDADEFLNTDLYALGEGAAVDLAAPIEEKPADTSGGPVCPGCKQTLPKTAKICVTCGIDLKTGRAILTTSEQNLDEIYATVESALKVVSWIVWFGLYPIASEALGVCKPYVTWGITAITILISVGAWIATAKNTGGGSSPRMETIKQMCLWAGDAEYRTPEEIEGAYYSSEFGDHDAWEARFEDLKLERKAKKSHYSDNELARAALKSLPWKDRPYGKYESSQLITHTFLHEDIMHLVGNMIFFLVIGGRVNAMIGNVAMLILYFVLAICAALIQMATMQHETPHYLIGASGAIMGMAGMYFILCPVQKVHMVLWWRWIFFFRIGFRYWLFSRPGYWILLVYYIGFDVLIVFLDPHDTVAHWAHLGGFLSGMAIALILLISRLVNARGGDLLSAILGRRAWWLVGKPDASRQSIIAIV